MTKVCRVFREIFLVRHGRFGVAGSCGLPLFVTGPLDRVTVSWPRPLLCDFECILR